MKHYTMLVEHYFRLGVRSPTITGGASAEWFECVRFWLNTLTPGDRAFLYTVFDSEDANTQEGLYKVPGYFKDNLHRLHELENNFARYAKLV